jgi:hypothetical protein
MSKKRYFSFLSALIWGISWNHFNYFDDFNNLILTTLTLLAGNILSLGLKLVLALLIRRALGLWLILELWRAVLLLERWPLLLLRIELSSRRARLKWSTIWTGLTLIT